MSEYEKLIEYFNSDNPDGDGFHLQTDQFFMDMDQYVDEHGVNYYCMWLEDKRKKTFTTLDIYNEDTVYICSSIGQLLLEQHILPGVFKRINDKIEQLRIAMLRNIQTIMNQ